MLLSGGLDSSTVAGLVAERSVRAYSAVFPGHPDVDESQLIDVVCDRLALPATRIAVRGGSALAGALLHVAAWAQPPVSPNLFFWLPLLRQAAAEATSTLLDGEGGDELLGLSPFLLADRVRRGRLHSEHVDRERGIGVCLEAAAGTALVELPHRGGNPRRRARPRL